ncbi:hypothetical protein LEM8419_01604 [Neolewinella maritima]|uniref:WbqC family protein n=1 Tax=Neolewinella maritima TaxID=1383882 RepID=A0ABM9B0A4_9BACT|nr:WbqC family protein [Neolewinella maritima]CAH1000451.1 hypothetical protein LEM8419_01604 [Neolewinella maritima]
MPTSSHLVTTTAYFPPLEWFVAALASNEWRWEAKENYQKGGWRNRCMILSANGPLRLSVPLLGGKHQQMPIQEVRIDRRTDWQRQHVQSIRSAYGRAPFFEHYGEEVLQLIDSDTDTLWELNCKIAEGLLRLFGASIELLPTEVFRGGAAGAGYSTPPPLTSYPQVFADRFGYVGGLSVLDGLFCLGPELAVLGLVQK